MLTSFLLYLRQFYDPMQDVGVFYNSLQSATAALEKIAALLAEPADVARAGRRRRALPQPARGGASGFDAVELRLPRRRGRCCPRSTLDIPAGQTVALVGATGAGKTTIAKLIARFYDPTAGHGRARRRRPARASPTPTCAAPSS